MARMSPARTTWKRHPAGLFVFLFALLAAAPALAADEAPPASGYGFAAGVFASQFIAGDAGPVTLVSETLYSDTFDTGFGLRLEGYRNYGNGWRGQVGLVYEGWSGKYFSGGAFPAGVQFEDFSVYGIYAGVRYLMGRADGYQPYIVSNLGAVYLSSLSVVSGGTTIPYWTGNWGNYFELGAGVSRRTGNGAITLDVRLQMIGAPDPAAWPLAAGTNSTSFLLAVGYDRDVRR
jgi:hypothetical protein